MYDKTTKTMTNPVVWHHCLDREPVRDRTDSAEDGEQSYPSDGTGSGRDRAVEGAGSDDMGTPDEQHPTGGERNRDSLGRYLGSFYCNRYLGIVDSQAVTEIAPDRLHRTFGKIGAIVHHGQQDSVNRQLGIGVCPYLLDRLKQLCHCFCRQVLRLNRDDYTVCGGQSVQRQHTERRTAVNQNIVIIVLDLTQICFHHALATHRCHKIVFGGFQIHIGRQQIHALGVLDDAFIWIVPFFTNDRYELIGERHADIICVIAEAGSQIALRIGIDE